MPVRAFYPPSVPSPIARRPARAQGLFESNRGMTSVAPTPSAEPTPFDGGVASLPGRLLGMIRSPRQTLHAVAENPRWLGVLAVTFAVSVTLSKSSESIVALPVRSTASAAATPTLEDATRSCSAFLTSASASMRNAFLASCDAFNASSCSPHCVSRSMTHCLAAASNSARDFLRPSASAAQLSQCFSQRAHSRP